MEAVDKYILKVGLETLRAAGGAGVSERALRDQIDLAAGAPLYTEQIDNALQMMKERGWMDFHLDRIFNYRRWTLTERGATALEGLK